MGLGQNEGGRHECLETWPPTAGMRERKGAGEEAPTSHVFHRYTPTCADDTQHKGMRGGGGACDDNTLRNATAFARGGGGRDRQRRAAGGGGGAEARLGLHSPS